MFGFGSKAILYLNTFKHGLTHRISFYSHLPASPQKQLTSRTFSILPPTSHPLYHLWAPASNTIATDEISAHMGMFNPRTNDGFYDLGLAVASGLAERIEEEGVGRIGGTEPLREEGMTLSWKDDKEEIEKAG